MNDIVIPEYAQTAVDLTDADALALRRSFDKRIAVWREAGASMWTVAATAFVGVVTLPSGRRLVVRPKAPVASVFAMLAVAEPDWRGLIPDPASLAGFDDALDALVAAYADAVAERIDRGLLRAYREQEENLGAVRGAIVFSEDVRRNLVERQRTWCRFDDLSWDVPENQVMLSGLLVAGRLVRDRRLRMRVTMLERRLGGVSVPRDPLGVLRRITRTRLNATYDRVLAFARIFLEAGGSWDRPGGYAAHGFLIDMNRLFERYVAAIVRSRAPEVSVLTQYPTQLDRGGKVALAIDLVVRLGEDVAVADTKYKVDGPFASNADVYQMLAYCTATGARHAALIHPAAGWSEARRLTIPTACGDVIVHAITIDLSVAIDAMAAEGERFATSLFDALFPLPLEATLAV